MAILVATKSGFPGNSKNSNALPWSNELVGLALLPALDPMGSSLEVALVEEDLGLNP